MKIKLTKGNEARIDAALTKANGRARERCARVGDVFAMARSATNHLNKVGLPKKARKGTYVRAHEGLSCNSYGYRCYSTEYVLECNANGDWFLIGAARVQIHTNRNCKHDWLTLGTAAREWIADVMPGKIERDF